MVAFGRTRTAALLLAAAAALQPGLRAADQQQVWRISDPEPFCQLLLRRGQAFGQRGGPATTSDRFVTSLARHKKDVQAVIEQANSVHEAAEELHRLTAEFAENSANSGMTLPSSLSIHDPGSYYELFKLDHPVPYMVKLLEERKRASIKDTLSRARFRSAEDRDGFVASRLCEIVNLYLDMLDNEQEKQADWGQLIRD